MSNWFVFNTFGLKHTTMKKIIFLFLAIIALTSCSITKRHYAPGYHVEWKGRHSHVDIPQTPLADRSERVESNSIIENAGTEVNASLSVPSVSNFSNPMEDFQTSDSEQIVEENASQESLAGLSETIVEPIGKSSEVGNQEPTEIQPLPTPTSDNINTMALVGFILSCASFLLFITALPGLVISVIGLKQIKEGNGEGKGLAIAGIVIGALYTLFIIGYVALVVFLNSGII